MKILRLLLAVVVVQQSCYEAKKPSNSKFDSEQLQAELLRVVGMKGKPTVSRGRSRVPKYVMDLYRRRAFLDGFTKEGMSAPGATVRTFFRESIKRFTSNYRLLTFKLSATPASEKLTTAKLRIFIRRSHSSVQATKRRSPGVFKISLYQLGRRWRKDGKWKRKSVLAAQRVIKCKRHGEWVSLNVTKALVFWRKYPGKNHGFWIDVKAHNARYSDFRIATGGRKEPILVTFGVDRTKLKQIKQAVEERSKGAAEKNIRERTRMRTRRFYSNYCQRHRLYIKFRDLKWDDWIIAPRGFSAYYCKGRCPEVIEKYFNPTNHAIIQNVVHHRYNKSVPAACCVPTKLNSMSLLYFERDGSIVLKEYAEMVASTCGCR